MAQLLPDDNLQVYIRRENSSTPRSLVSISAIKSFMVSNGLNIAILCAATYYSQGCYVIAAKPIASNITELYIADDTLLNTVNPQVPYDVGFSNIGGSRPANFTYGNIYVLSYDGSSFQLATGFEYNFSSKAVNNITYLDVGSSRTSESFPAYIILNYDGDIYVNGSPLVNYTWSSVPSISGKNGILSLTQILNINDGEPVENVTNRGNLDFSKKTKVNTLVNSVYEPTHEEDQTKATIEYEIPEAEYQYTKLVYKKKKIPKSPNDGTDIDIGVDDTEAFVSGLEENTTYYFAIFTNRTKSNAYKFKTGANPVIEAPFRETVEVLKKTGDDEFTSVYEWTGKWGKPDDASTTHFTVEAQEILNITESATETHFTVEYNETNFISENTETEIILT